MWSAERARRARSLRRTVRREEARRDALAELGAGQAHRAYLVDLAIGGNDKRQSVRAAESGERHNHLSGFLRVPKVRQRCESRKS